MLARPHMDEAHAASRPILGSRPPQGRRISPWPDRAFQGVATLCAFCVVAAVGLVAWQLVLRSGPSIREFGWRFFSSGEWDPVSGSFGALPFIYGTLVSSAVAMVLAVPLGVGVALFTTEIAPNWIKPPVRFLVELLAAIPSVIYGLWGIFVLAPLLRKHVEPFLAANFKWTGLFDGPALGIGMLAAGVLLAIMVVPYVAALTRDVMLAVSRQHREAALALGATRWEMVRMAVLRNSRAGILGAVVLGLGRALGETMAVTMVIGNRPEVAKSLFAPGYTLASVIANEFSEATSDLYLSALVEIGLALFLITLVVNVLAQLMLWTVTRGMPARTAQ